jgi:hypothetical protein
MPLRAQPIPAWTATTTNPVIAEIGVNAGTFFSTDPVSSGRSPAPPGTVSTFSTVKLPAKAPRYLSAFYQSALRAPLPSVVYMQGGVPATVPQTEWDMNSSGLSATYQPLGATVTSTNAFFQSLGTNGRSCVTCHQPPNGMSVSVPYIQARYVLTGGRDPIFAPVDGANCPNAVSGASTSGSLLGRVFGKGTKSFAASHSLLLNRGLFRIFLPVPSNAEFTVTTVSDPNGCNTDPNYNQVTNPDGTVTQIVSAYRRPRMAANLNILTQTDNNTKVLPGIDLLDGSALTVDPVSGLFESGNIMWDGREPTLQSQATDATLGHAQALAAPTDAQVAQMVSFENGIFAAQTFISGGGWLQGYSGKGGPDFLSTAALGLGFPAAPTDGNPIDLYSAYVTTGNATRASIVRGQHIFNTRTFSVSNVAGFNNALGIGQGVSTTCATCHNQHDSGADGLSKSQHDIGVGGASQAFGGPAPDPTLPIFRVTCSAGAATAYHGSSMLTNDLGAAMITGKCADVGRLTVPQLRGLASQAPFFSDGSAATLSAVVTFYNNRFNIGLSAQDKTDLSNFLQAL